MSPADSADPEPEYAPLRLQYSAELDQLRIQVELMGVRVDENLERMREVLRTGDARLAALGVNADDDIDAMNVSLTERCYDILRREAPVAADLRVPLIDAQRHFDGRGEAFADESHLTRAGHQELARLVRDTLRREGVLP